MIKRYNIALIPSTASQLIVSCASNFVSISDCYQLGGTSLPHVTIYQFTAGEDEISSIIEKIKTTAVHRAIELSFDTFSCITFDNRVYWASLMPNKVEELNQMHQQIAKQLNQPIKPTYDPHMTLMSTLDSSYETLVDEVKRDYQPIKDNFILTLGESDEIGQYLRVLEVI